MHLGGWSYVEVTAVEYPVSIKLEALLRRTLLAEIGASNLQSNFLLGLGDERAFLDLHVPRRAI